MKQKKESGSKEPRELCHRCMKQRPSRIMRHSTYGSMCKVCMGKFNHIIKKQYQGNVTAAALKKIEQAIK